MSCFASGRGFSGRLLCYVFLEPDTPVYEFNDVSNSSDLDYSLEVSDNTTVEKESDISIDENEISIDFSDADSGKSSEAGDTITVEEESDTSVDDPKDVSNSFKVDLVVDTTKSNYSILENFGGSLAFNAVFEMPDPGVVVNRNSQNSVSV